MIQYIEKVIQTIVEKQPSSISIMDDFKAHSVDPVIEKLQSLQISHKIIPGGFTSTLQPLDVSLNKPFKDYYREEWNNWMDSPYPIYTECGNRQKPSYQELVNWLSRSLYKISEIKESVKHSIISLILRKCVFFDK